MSRPVLSQRPSGANPSTVYRVETAWGFMYVDVRTNAVTGITPPAPGNAATFGIDARDASVPTHVRELADRLVSYFDGEDVELVEAAALGQWLDAAGITGARRAMSLALHGVPRGVTLSYGDLAMLAGSPGAARAAGTMCARNPLPVVIPCHRVVHAGAKRGDVGSYGAANGPDYKRRLLELENAALVR